MRFPRIHTSSNLLIKAFLLMISLNISTSNAQVKNNAVSININEETNEAENTSEVIDPSAQIEGITIINKKVFIDGIEVPKNAKKFISKNSKKTFIINRDKNENIIVSENH